MFAADFDPEPVTNWFLLVLAIGGVVSLIAGVVVKVNRGFEHRVSDLIKEATRPIQPESNGGLSMTDLHAKVDRFEGRYEKLMDEQEKQRQLWHERYLADQLKVRREWTAVFIAIRKMIHLPADQQAEMWDRITDGYINGTLIEQFPDERRGDEDVQ